MATQANTQGSEAQGATATASGASAGKLTARQALVLGATLFSMFFGAGNLILPPLLGAQAGADALPALVGFLVTAIGFPVLGIVAVALAGDLKQLAGRVSPWSSTAFEMLVPLLPAGVPVLGASVAFSVAFFAASFALALRPGKLSKILGRISAPALIVLIVAVVGSSLVAPLGEATPAVEPYTSAPAVQGFINGYQTMDLLAALCFGIVIAMNVRDMGVERPASVAAAISRSGVIAGVLMLAVYCGLGYVGVVTGAVVPGAENGAQLLTAAATGHFGLAGTVIVAAIFLIACLNVCTGLISSCSQFFSETFPRVPYRAWAAGFAIFSCAVSNFGLTAIIAFSVPLLTALYPVAIVLVLMGMAARAVDRVPFVWKWTVGVVAVESVIVSLRDAFAPGAWLPFDALPFADLGLSWIAPALVGVLLGLVHSALAARQKR